MTQNEKGQIECGAGQVEYCQKENEKIHWPLYVMTYAMRQENKQISPATN